METGQEFYPPPNLVTKPGRRWLYILLLSLLLFVVISIVIWLVWFRNMKLMSFMIMEFQVMWNIAMWPIKTLFGFLGLWNPSDANVVPPPINMTTTEIVKHELSECPPCNCSCECPECEKVDTEVYDIEIKYLKDMVRLTGAIAKRENAINAQYKELYPGFSVMSPHVIKLSTEYQMIKEELRKDEEEWAYFKNYFSKLSNIPSVAPSNSNPISNFD